MLDILSVAFLIRLSIYIYIYIYSTELKTQHLIYQKFYSSFHMQTFVNLISCFLGFNVYFP